MTNFYQTLGVDKNASEDDIKKAYRKLASQHHPDRGGDTKKFQDIEEAYRTLSNPETRAQYDNPQPQFNGGGGFGGGMPPGFEDIMSHMFGGGSNPFGFSFNSRQPQRNKTFNLQTVITLEDAFFGKDMLASVQLPTGKDQTIEIKIPAGIQDGTTLRLAGMGDDTYPQLPRGDIHLSVKIEPHKQFARQGDDLILNIKVNCIDAILGKNETITTIDKKSLDVKINPGTQHGQILSVAGHGMPKMSDNRFKGRLLLQINIDVPTNLNAKQLDKLKELYN